ncbi:MAG: hypothetical protein KF782_35570, partial [Labilithrix sp.]|nr:hypothetical protein [Labilithrix sp.]
HAAEARRRGTRRAVDAGRAVVAARRAGVSSRPGAFGRGAGIRLFRRVGWARAMGSILTTSGGEDRFPAEARSRGDASGSSGAGRERNGRSRDARDGGSRHVITAVARPAGVHGHCMDLGGDLGSDRHGG